MKLRLTAFLTLLAAVALVATAAPMAATAKPSAKPTKPKAAAANVDVPVTGTVTNAVGGAVGTFAGDYTIDRVTRHGRRLLAIGTVTGVVTNTATGETRTVNRAVKIPLRATVRGTGAGNADAFAPQATCGILDLTFGPVDLDLLGLVVHLDTVHLNITAESGPGNLLGNLLCAVAGLLDPVTGGGGLGAILNQIVALLNQILGAIGG
jgi:hypothetical protein